jgi:Uncharacterized protein conserved in bacteria
MSSPICGLRTAAAACALIAVALTNASPASATNAPKPLLEYIGQATIPTGTTFDGTVVGGLSGIDYDNSADTYYAISDDRSQLSPARFYTLGIDLSDGQLDQGDVTLNSVVTLLDTNNQPFAALSVDPESIRFNPTSGTVFWSSEGDANAFVAPFVREATTAGTFIRELVTPAKYLPTPTTGIRNNLAFESLSFRPSRLTIFTATENALTQDGPAADLTQGSPSRILESFVGGGKPRREFVYVTDPVADVPVPAGSFSTNGLVEILGFASDRFVSVERSFSNGVGNVIKVFLVDLRGATDVTGLESLDGQTYTPAKKLLIANFADYGIVPDNIEGVTFGPILPNGRQALIFVADNNFSATQTTQFVAFSFKPGTLFCAIKPSTP